LTPLFFPGFSVRIFSGQVPFIPESEGLKILVCGTCLDHFDVLEKKQVGETTNMLDIVTAMQLADKVINL